MRTLALFFLAVAFASEAQQNKLVSTGQIAGIVKGEDGSSVSGAYVLAKRSPARPLQGKQRTDWTAVTSSDGTFQIAGIPNGRYTICVQTPGTAWLNPCEWGSAPPSVAVSGAQRSVNPAVVLKRGASVAIRIDDPNQLLAQHEGKTPGAHLLLGVRTDALTFHTAVTTAQDSASRTYAVTIPFDAKINLVVASSFYRLTDANGLALTSGSSTVPVLVPTGQSPPTVRIGVTGRNGGGR